MATSLQIRGLAGALGAELRGIDLSRPLDPAERKALEEALHRYGVLCIRGQQLDHPALLAFARSFGTPDVHPIAKGMSEHPEIIRVLKPAGENAFFGTSWHSDNSFFERPSSLTILYGEKVPPVGGDTVFTSMERAFEMLSEPMRRFLEPLSAIHSARTAYDPKTTGEAKYRGETAIQYTYSETIYEEVVHPLVRTHPVTGRRSLYVNPMFTQQIVGLSKPESAALLALLYDLSTRPELTCRVQWENGTLTMWDNRWLQHYAIDDYADYERIMYRVTIQGERPV
ncbi:MAG: TauD/TfdA family dioxygenase [Myxococcota bacterium]